MIISSMKIQAACFLFFTLTGVVLSENSKCPFNYMFHFGDGATDVGNSVLIPHYGPSLPPTRPPYGITVPGKPNGRWSDGLTDFDIGVPYFGFPGTVPYLSKNFSSKVVVFSVARSPVLHRKFFTSRGVRIPPYAVSLNQQLRWFKAYLNATCSTEKDRASIVGNSMIFLGDSEGNDIGYALSQGKSIEEVKTYIPFITRAQIRVAKELIRMGATRILIPGSTVLGCYPYMLTARYTNDSAAYDSLGCLKDVNDLNALKNNDLRQAVRNLSQEYPNLTVFYGPYDEGVLTHLREISKSNSTSKEVALKACCGIGGKYNYDSNRFCGSEGVPVCSNPSEYVFWDGFHFTHDTTRSIVESLIEGLLVRVNCTVV